MKEVEGELISGKGRHIQWGRKQQSNVHEREEWAWKQRPRCPTKTTVREVVGCRAGKLSVLPKVTTWLSEEEIKSGAAGDNETLEGAQGLGQRKRSSAVHQHRKSQRGTERGCRDCWGEKRDCQARKQEKSGWAVGEEMDGNQEKDKTECRSKEKLLANEEQDALSTTLNWFSSVLQTKQVISRWGSCQMFL